MIDELINKLVQSGFYAQFGLTIPPEWDWHMREHDAYDHAQIISGHILPFKGEYVPASPYGEIWATCSEYARAEVVHGHQRFPHPGALEKWLSSAVELATLQGWDGSGPLPTFENYKKILAYWEYFFQ